MKIKRIITLLCIGAFIALGIFTTAAGTGTHSVSINDSTKVITNPQVKDVGKIIFPVVDPHVPGAGYWSSGVLHQSTTTPTATATSTSTPTATATPTTSP